MLMTLGFQFWLWGASKVALSSPVVHLRVSSVSELLPCTRVSKSEYLKVTGNVFEKWALLNLCWQPLYFPVIFSIPALKLHPVYHSIRCSGFLVYFTNMKDASLRRDELRLEISGLRSCSHTSVLGWNGALFSIQSVHIQKNDLSVFMSLLSNSFLFFWDFVAAWALIQAST